MKKIKPDNMSLLLRNFEHRNRPRMSMAILGGFTLDEVPRLLSEKELWAAAATELGETQYLDAGMPKPKGEAMAAGRAWAPAGKTVTGLEVSFSVGNLRKNLLVLGNRKWKRVAGMLEAASDPEPFTQMPIDYTRAFGGPGFERNPLGLGLAVCQTPSGETIKPLPNVEWPGRTITSPTDKPMPTGFGPLSETWTPRVKRAGTFDRQWLFKAWPYYPDDLDWTFFNAAPEDQWLDGYFHGDERVTVVNMSPDRPRISSRLPGIQARCFIDKKISGGLSFLELKTYLETVWLFPGANTGVILFRAVVETIDDEASDLEHLLLEWEPLEERRPVEYYAELLKQKLAVVPIEETPQAAPVEPPLPSVTIEPLSGPPPEILARLAKADEEVAQVMATAREKLVKAGQDPDKFLATAEKSPFDGLSLEAKLATADNLIAQAEKQLQQTIKSAGLNLKAMLKQSAKQPVLTPMDLAKKLAGNIPRGAAAYLRTIERKVAQTMAEADEIRAIAKKLGQERAEPAALAPPLTVEDVLAAKHQGRDMTGWDLSGLDLSDLDLSGVLLAMANLSRSKLLGTNLSGADLTKADLSEADFSKADLTAVRAPHCRGRQAIFKNTVLVKADLAQADLTQADFSSADMKRANLQKSSLTSAILNETDLTGADLSEADLEGVQAGQAKFVQTNLVGACLDKAGLTAADFTASQAEKASLVGADLTGARFPKARLVKADFSQCLLTRANFEQARLSAAFFHGAKGEAVVFQGADLTQSRANAETSLLRSTFTQAKMDQACWGGAGLEGAFLTGTSMHRADFSGANLVGANLVAVSAREVRFQKTDLTGADLKLGDFFKGNFRKSRVGQVDFQGASLYMADFFRAVVDRTNFKSADLKRGTFDIWKMQS